MESAQRRRGRPRSYDRDEVVDDAMRVFWAHGYEGASLALLQAATGLSAPSIYNEFGSKAGLYDACLSRYVEQVGAQMGVEIQSEVADEAALARLLAVAARQFTDPAFPPGCMISASGLDMSPQCASVAREVAGRRQVTLSALVDFFCRAQAGGALDAHADAAALARFYGAVIQGMSVQARDGATTDELLAVADFALASWPRV